MLTINKIMFGATLVLGLSSFASASNSQQDIQCQEFGVYRDVDGQWINCDGAVENLNANEYEEAEEDYQDVSEAEYQEEDSYPETEVENSEQDEAVELQTTD